MKPKLTMLWNGLRNDGDNPANVSITAAGTILLNVGLLPGQTLEWRSLPAGGVSTDGKVVIEAEWFELPPAKKPGDFDVSHGRPARPDETTVNFVKPDYEFSPLPPRVLPSPGDARSGTAISANSLPEADCLYDIPERVEREPEERRGHRE